MNNSGKSRNGKIFRGALVLLMAGLGSVYVLSGCRDLSGVESFSLECDNPGTVTLTEDPGVAEHREGLLLEHSSSAGDPDGASLSTPEYRLSITPEVHEDSALFLSYRSEIPVRAHLGYDGEKHGVFSLPSTNGTEAEVALPLSSSPLESFRISAEKEESEDAGFRLTRVRIASRIDGAVQRQGYITFSAGMEGWESLGFGGTRLSFSPELLELTRGRFSQQRVKIVYSYFPPEDDPQRRVSVEEVGPEKASTEGTAEMRKELREPPRPHSIIGVSGKSAARRSYRMYVKEGNNTVYLYSRSLGFTPQSVEISLPSFSEEKKEDDEEGMGNFSVQSVTIEQVPMYAEESPEPLPADMGTVLRYDQSDWRRSDWELFSWSVFPRMLIFDFKNYEVQARFLKRLAFFVEKDGYTGELHTNEVIGDLHGWNAHDYRAEDLAEFFNTAKEQAFPLNKEERTLAQILIENGILRRHGDGYAPGVGGFISISRESGSRLRHLLLTHEGAHGLYFASRHYRNRISEIWSPLSDSEKRFWRYFLAWRNYNVDDPYLMENEFQAYLMQQHISYTDTYFREYIFPRYVNAFPEHEEEVRRFFEEHPDHFVENTRRVSDAAKEAAGVTAGDLVRLRPAGSSGSSVH